MDVDLKLSLLKIIYGTSLVKIAKEINRVLLKNAKLNWFKIQNFRKIVKIKCYKICKPQNREINMLWRFHVIRHQYLASTMTNNELRWPSICIKLSKLLFLFKSCVLSSKENKLSITRTWLQSNLVKLTP